MHTQCQCTINGIPDNGLTYAGALLYANGRNACTDALNGVVISKQRNISKVEKDINQSRLGT
jgi:hypothetical protein